MLGIEMRIGIIWNLKRMLKMKMIQLITKNIRKNMKNKEKSFRVMIKQKM